MKKLKDSVERRLQKKKISIVDYIFRLREGRGMTLTEMANKMNVKLPYLSRILSGIGENITLETIVKCEDALEAEIIVCPGEYEERLIDKPERLWLIVSTALEVDGSNRLLVEISADPRVQNAVLLGVFDGSKTLNFENDEELKITYSLKDKTKKTPNNELKLLEPKTLMIPSNV